MTTKEEAASRLRGFRYDAEDDQGGEVRSKTQAAGDRI